MSALPKPNPEQERLIAAYLDGDATPEQIERLETHLTEPDFQKLLAVYAIDEANLDELASQRGLASAWGGSPGGTWPWWSVAVAAAAVLLAVGVGYWASVAGSRALPDRAAATPTLDRMAGRVVVFDSPDAARSARRGQTLDLGRELRTLDADSSADVLYPDGTRVSLGGNTFCALDQSDGAKSLTVGEGRLVASVVGQAPNRPLLISTPHAQLRVLGTELAVTVTVERTQLTVQSGQVRLTRLADGRSIEVGAGHAAQASQDLGELVAREMLHVPETFEADFEQGLPEGWHLGVRVVEDLPAGSRGAVRAVPVPGAPLGVHHQIRSPSRWGRGLFRIHPDTYFNIRFKFEKDPGFFHIIVSARTLGPGKSETMNLFGGERGSLWGGRRRGAWYTVSIPFAQFRIDDAGPDVLPPDLMAYALIVDSQRKDRGLVVDRIWVTRGEPGI